MNWGMVKIILALAWPTVVEQAMQTAVQYIDTAMVGSLGPQATAAIALVTPANWMLNGVMGGIAVGCFAVWCAFKAAKKLLPEK